MVIKSHVEDFFDHLPKIHGIDEKIIYERHDYYVQEELKIRYDSWWNKQRNETYITVPVLIGDEMHLFYVKDSHNIDGKLYSKEEIIEERVLPSYKKLLKNRTIGLDEFGLPDIKKRTGRNNQLISLFANEFDIDPTLITTQNSYSQIPQIFSNGVLKSNKISELNEDGLSYIILEDIYMTDATLNYSIERLPLMKNINLNKYLDAEYVYQTLYNFLVVRHQKMIDSKSYIEKDNKLKIKNAGFDLKTSFRGK